MSAAVFAATALDEVEVEAFVLGALHFALCSFVDEILLMFP